MEKGLVNGDREVTLTEHELYNKIGLCILRNGKKNINELKLSLHEIPLPKKADSLERIKNFARKYDEYTKNWQYGEGQVDEQSFKRECDDYGKMLQYEYNLVRIRYEDLKDIRVMKLMIDKEVYPGDPNLLLWHASLFLENEMNILHASLMRLTGIEDFYNGFKRFSLMDLKDLK